MEREELEKWLKQSFYPYFYVNSTSFGEFDAFDVENYADVMGEDKVEAIRENISDYWGIHDRKSLMKQPIPCYKKAINILMHRLWKN